MVTGREEESRELVLEGRKEQEGWEEGIVSSLDDFSLQQARHLTELRTRVRL